jgi:FKBP-type peptidyl-prolyl cis-trans isomerase FkpA
MKMYFLTAFSLLILFSGCKEEMKTTKSGHEYKIHVDAAGDLPKPGDVVYFHATIRQDGKDSILFDSRSYPDLPNIQIPEAEEVAADQAQGNPMVELLSLLSLGDSATVIHKLDTTTAAQMGIPGAKELHYDVVVMEIKTKEAIEAEQEAAKKQAEEVSAQITAFAASFSGGKVPAGVQKSQSGLQYVIVDKGSGKPAEFGQKVRVHYYGVLPDGTMFDNSYDRGQTLDFELGDEGLIKGWTEGVALLHGGGKAMLNIPYPLGYGEEGSPPVIPAKSNLFFFIELVDNK